MRKIIHVDMDAFFASIEQHDFPELQGKPIVVGYDGSRGVVSTASYEARRFGIHSAMPISLAKRLCKELIIQPSRFDRYKEVSRQINEVFHEYTDLVEPLSLDEAFLDVTENKKNVEMAVDLAKEIKNKILIRTGLTASAGVSYNKFLAKIASDWHKPDGLFTIHPDRAADFISNLPIEKFWGIGAKTAKKMHYMGVFKGSQLREISLSHLTDTFGKAGKIYYDFARGIDGREVIAIHERKSVGCEKTFLEDISTNAAIIIELYHLVIELVERIAHSNFKGLTLTLKMKYADMSQVTRSTTGPGVLCTKNEILPLAKKLLKRVDTSRSVRLMGLTVSHPLSEDGSGRKNWIEGELEFEDYALSPPQSPKRGKPHLPKAK